MPINEEKYESLWAEWETKMEKASGFLIAASDLDSIINVDGHMTVKSSEKIQLVIDQLQEAKSLVENLEFIDALTFQEHEI